MPAWQLWSPGNPKASSPRGGGLSAPALPVLGELLHLCRRQGGAILTPRQEVTPGIHGSPASGYSPSTHCQVLGPATAGVAGCTPTVQGGSGCGTGNRLRTLWRPRHDCQQRAWGTEGGPWEKSAPTSHCLSWGQQSRDMGDAARGQCSGLPSWGSGEQTLGQCECPALARAAEHPGTSPGPRDSLRAP